MIADDARMILDARGVERVFPARPAPLAVLRGIDLTVRAQETVAIVGASGSGKSTLLHILGCLDHPTKGEVFLESHNLMQLYPSQQAELRNQKIGFVFQFHYLLPEFTARENVAMPLLVAGQPRKKSLEAAGELLRDVGLAERMEHRPRELSGGEQQRVAIARALAGSPAVVLADEPTGNLDRLTGLAVTDLLWQMNRSRKIALVIVTHNQEIASRADKILELKDGKLWPR